MNIRERLLSPRGKISRAEYIYGLISTIFVIFIFSVFLPVLITEIFKPFIHSEAMVYIIVVCIESLKAISTFIAVIAFIFLIIKRLRDCNFSPWFVLLLFIPLVNAALILFLAIYNKKIHVSSIA